MRIHQGLLALVLALWTAEAVQAQGQFGGGLLPRPAGDGCITAVDRMCLDQNIACYHAEYGFRIASDPGRPAPYAFHPQAGNLWRDLFVFNFADLDPTTGVRDWDCGNWTYDGHRGHDVDLRSFGEQEFGVPVFAALDGTVVDAHDGEFDRQTAWTGAPANYVVLWHGGTHYTLYWHLKKDSVRVAVGQVVKAGTQLGLTGSSGNSTGPHLHFESLFEGNWYEPYAGRCRPGESSWISQTPIRRDTYLRDFNITDVNPGDYGAPPHDMPRAGTFVVGTRAVAFRMILHNLPAASRWQVRYLRPDGSVALDTGAGGFGNPFYRWSWWWWRHQLDLDVPGTWLIEFFINGQTLVRAPFEVASSAEQIANRPPYAIEAGLDPPNSIPSDVLFCRVATSLTLDDPDYEIVRYRYQWSVNGTILRDVTTAAQSDAVPRDVARAGDTVQCVVTPTDGRASGPPTTVQAVVGLSIAGTITENGAGLAGVTVTADGRSTTTGSDGAYRINGLPPGSYTVTPSKSGYDFTPKERVLTLETHATGVSFTAQAQPLVSLLSLTLDRATIPGGLSTSGKVTLGAPAPVDVTVTLASDKPAAAVPPSVTVKAGETCAAFPVTTSIVPATTTANLTASYGGATRSAPLEVRMRRAM